MLDLLLNRRSIRKFTSEPVAETDIQKILQAGLLSPSGRNKTPWEFVVIQEESMLKAMGKCRHPQQSFLPETPLAIAVLGDTNATDVWVEDCAIAMTIMQLQAQTLGLGSCWVQVRNRMAQDEVETSSNYIKTMLNVPAHYEVLAILAIGHPDEEKAPYRLDALQYNKIHKDLF